MNPEPFDLREVAEDIKQLILATHKVEQIKNSFDYKGKDLIDNSFLAHSCTLKESMEQENVEIDAEDGYDMLDTIIYKTLQLGYQNRLLYEQSLRNRPDEIQPVVAPHRNNNVCPNCFSSNVLEGPQFKNCLSCGQVFV